jgi:predicted ArsR family transcriptional regulator
MKAEYKNMEGMTVTEIAKELKISVDAVRKRIETAKITPISREVLYDKSVLNILKDVKMGRPKKAPPEPEPPVKPAKRGKAKK